MTIPARKSFPYVPVGAIIEGDEAHLCVLGEDGWPHYTSVPVNDPAKWRKALATLADPNTPTLGKHRRPPVRKPFWLCLEAEAGEDLPLRLLGLVLLPKGRLSLMPRAETDAYAARLGVDGACRFDYAELLANYVLRNDPPTEDELLDEAGGRVGLAVARFRARG